MPIFTIALLTLPVQAKAPVATASLQPQGVQAAVVVKAQPSRGAGGSGRVVGADQVFVPAGISPAVGTADVGGASVQNPTATTASRVPASAVSGPCESSLARQLTKAMLFGRIPSVRQWDARCKELAISKLFEDEEVVAFLGSQQGLETALAQLESLIPNLPEGLFQQFVDVVNDSMQGEVAFAMNPPRHANTGVMADTQALGGPELYLSVDLTNAPERFDSLLGDVVQFVRIEHGDRAARRVVDDSIRYFEFRDPSVFSDSDAGFRVGRKGNTVFMAGPSPTSMHRVLGSAPAHSMATDPGFLEACELYTRRPGSMYFYMDGPAFLESIRAEKSEITPLGLDRLRWMGLSLEPDGECMRHRLDIRADAGHGIASLFVEKQSFDLAKFLPARTVFSMQMAVNGDVTSRALRQFVAKYSGRSEAGHSANMRRMREKTGTDFDEILGLVGDEVAFGIVMPETGGFVAVPDMHFVIRARSNEAAARLGRIIEFASQRLIPDSSLQTTTFEKTTISYVGGGSGFTISPALLVDGDLVVINSSLFAAKHWLQFRRSAAPTLAAAEIFKNSFSALGDSVSTATAWIDWTSIVRFVYGNFGQIAPLLFERSRVAARDNSSDPDDADPDDEHEHGAPVPAISIFGSQLDWSKMPGVDTVSSYIRPQAIRFRVNSGGLTMESRAIF